MARSGRFTVLEGGANGRGGLPAPLLVLDLDGVGFEREGDELRLCQQAARVLVGTAGFGMDVALLSGHARGDVLRALDALGALGAHVRAMAGLPLLGVPGGQPESEVLEAPGLLAQQEAALVRLEFLARLLRRGRRGFDDVALVTACGEDAAIAACAGMSIALPGSYPGLRALVGLAVPEEMSALDALEYCVAMLVAAR